MGDCGEELFFGGDELVALAVALFLDEEDAVVLGRGEADLVIGIVLVHWWCGEGRQNIINRMNSIKGNDWRLLRKLVEVLGMNCVRII